jgi:hypothetical protein
MKHEDRRRARAWASLEEPLTTLVAVVRGEAMTLSFG